MRKRVYWILHDETRRRILEGLTKRSMTFSEIMNFLTTKNTGRLCHHLRALKDYLVIKDGKYTLSSLGLSTARAARQLESVIENQDSGPSSRKKDRSWNKADILRKMRRVARNVSDQILSERDDVISIILEGSVAREDVTVHSDVGLDVFLDLKNHKDIPCYSSEHREVQDISVDISYSSIRDLEMQLETYYGFDWEQLSSSLEDCIILHDTNGVLKKLKKANKGYPLETRKRNARYFYWIMLEADEAAWGFYLSGDLEKQKVFAAVYAYRALRLVFPICGWKSRDEALLLEDATRLAGSVELEDNWKHLLIPSYQKDVTSGCEVCERMEGISNSIEALTKANGMREVLDHPYRVASNIL